MNHLARIPRTDVRPCRRWPPGGRLLAASLLLLVAALSGCDETDGDWDPPVEPGPQALPDLSVAVSYESAIDDHVNQGEPLVFQVDLANQGPGAAADVAVEITLPALVAIEEITTEPGRFDLETHHWELDYLESGASGVLRIATLVDEGTVGESLVFTAAIVASQPADTTQGDNDDRVQVTVVNSPPDADDDWYILSEGAVLAVNGPGLMGNDLDYEGEEITVDPVPVLAPTRGELVLDLDGGFTYIHDGSEAEADSFRYRITDASAESDTAMVRLEITLVNDRPRIADIEGYTIAEGGAFAPIDLTDLVTDDDHDLDELVWTVLGADELLVEVSEEDILTVTTPDADWNGTDVLLFRVRDPEGAVDNADVTFTVTPVNDPPVVSALPSQTVPVGGTFLPVPLDSYVADVDHADAEITWTYGEHEPLLVTISPSRVLQVAPPSPSWIGSVTMTLRATDPDGDWDERTCRFEVTAEK
jgi:hypothetical protein